MISFDPEKRRRNRVKHGIDLSECHALFDSPMLTRVDPRHLGEERLVSLGLLSGRVVVMVWTDRDPWAHIISCRKAVRHEEKIYFQAFPIH